MIGQITMLKKTLNSTEVLLFNSPFFGWLVPGEAPVLTRRSDVDRWRAQGDLPVPLAKAWWTFGGFMSCHLWLCRWNHGIGESPAAHGCYIYMPLIMFNWRTMAFWLYNYILVNDSYPVRWPMAIWQEPPWTKIAWKIRSIPEISDRGRQSGNISTRTKKNKSLGWSKWCRGFLFYFFVSGQWSHDKKRWHL